MWRGIEAAPLPAAPGRAWAAGPAAAGLRGLQLPPLPHQSPYRQGPQQGQVQPPVFSVRRDICCRPGYIAPVSHGWRQLRAAKHANGVPRASCKTARDTIGARRGKWAQPACRHRSAIVEPALVLLSRLIQPVSALLAACSAEAEIDRLLSAETQRACTHCHAQLPPAFFPLSQTTPPCHSCRAAYDRQRRLKKHPGPAAGREAVRALPAGAARGAVLPRQPHQDRPAQFVHPMPAGEHPEVPSAARPGASASGGAALRPGLLQVRGGEAGGRVRPVGEVHHAAEGLPAVPAGCLAAVRGRAPRAPSGAAAHQGLPRLQGGQAARRLRAVQSQARRAAALLQVLPGTPIGSQAGVWACCHDSWTAVAPTCRPQSTPRSSFLHHTDPPAAPS